MDVADLVHSLGGVADRGTIVSLTSRREFDRAVAGGRLDRVARGRYVLAEVADARRDAARVKGVLSHLSACGLHGLEVALLPEVPHVTVPRHRRTTTGVRLHFADLRPDEVDRGVTTPIRTVTDCTRSLSFTEALAVADSALRHSLDRDELMDAAARGPRTGRSKALRVLRLADPRAANPFESVLRGLAIEVGLDVRPQVWLAEIGGRPDLVDQRRRLALEADSFTWHGGRRDLERDCRRYDELVIAGWTVLRFAYEHVMFDQPFVRRVLHACKDGQFAA